MSTYAHCNDKRVAVGRARPTLPVRPLQSSQPWPAASIKAPPATAAPSSFRYQKPKSFQTKSSRQHRQRRRRRHGKAARRFHEISNELLNTLAGHSNYAMQLANSYAANQSNEKHLAGLHYIPLLAKEYV